MGRRVGGRTGRRGRISSPGRDGPSPARGRPAAGGGGLRGGRGGGGGGARAGPRPAPAAARPAGGMAAGASRSGAAAAKISGMDRAAALPRRRRRRPARRGRPVSAEPETEDRRAQIIRGAAAVLARQGYEATSMKEIAEEVGVSSGLLHY